MPIATESYDLSQYDVVISSTSAFAKGIITKPETLHICYCHTPTRYLWTESSHYLEETRAPRVLKALLPLYLSRLRLWDAAAASRVSLFIANSTTVQKRIKKFYGKESIVVHPPVAPPFKTYVPLLSTGHYFLTGGRLVPYKRFDIAINACSRLGLPLIVFGDGPHRAALQRMAGPTITFTGRVDEDTKWGLYAHSRAFINPQVEDFGITAVESMALGKPVIAYRHGGATETIIDGKTGVFFDYQSWEALAHVLLQYNETQFDAMAISKHAQQYSTLQFAQNMRHIVEHTWQRFKKI